jgi:hypothetical protein
MRAARHRASRDSCDCKNLSKVSRRMRYRPRSPARMNAKSPDQMAERNLHTFSPDNAEASGSVSARRFSTGTVGTAFFSVSRLLVTAVGVLAICARAPEMEAGHPFKSDPVLARHGPRPRGTVKINKIILKGDRPFHHRAIFHFSFIQRDIRPKAGRLVNPV